MPLVRVRRDGKVVGYRWGKGGKLYKKKEDALKQGRSHPKGTYKKKGK